METSQADTFDRLARLGCPVPQGSLVAATASLEKLGLALTTLRAEAAKTNPAPTEAQKESGKYKKGRVEWKGLDILIETAKGEERSGKSKDGTEWRTVMHDHYGYIGDSKSKADGDEIDVFLSEDNLDSEVVFIINQNKKDGSLDEHKCMLGCVSEEQARRNYLRNYSAGWNGLGSVRAMTLPDFKRWILEGDTSKRANVINGLS